MKTNNRNQAAAEEWAGIIQEMSEIVYRIDPDGKISFINNAVRKLGYRPPELIGQPFHVLIHPDDIGKVSRTLVLRRYRGRETGAGNAPKLFDERRTGRRKTLGLEVRLLHKNSRKNHFGLLRFAATEVNAFGKYGLGVKEKRKFLGTIGVIRDITERKMTEEMLRESEERYRTLFETMAQGVVCRNESGQITAANPAAEKITGRPLKQLRQMTPADPRWKAIHEDGKPYTAEEAPSFITLKTGEPQKNTVMGIFNPAEKTYRWINIQTLPRFLPEGKKPCRVYVMFEDITEQRRTEKELIRSEKMAELGMLASGIAHEINNPLTGIIGFAELLKKESSGLSADQKESAGFIFSESQRLKKLLNTLLAFARKQPSAKKPVCLNKTLLFALNLTGYQLEKSGFSVQKNLAENLPETLASEEQLLQVFINIINNAWQAKNTPGRGNLLLRTSAEEGRVTVCISDDGPGIPKENLSKIFNPFFTTKAENQGSGLGLFISCQIIKEHGGTISVESKPGKDTRFILRFPAIKNLVSERETGSGPDSRD